MGKRGELFSTKLDSSNERRSYFFNVKENRTGDLFLSIVESKKQNEASWERHQVVVFEEDFSQFMKALEGVMKRIETEVGERRGGV
ncbi:MAG: DUF3276 family protein [Alkalispirochaetaceae bacterium]